MRPGSCVGGSFGSPGSFVRKAAARAAGDGLYLYGGGLTPELAELIERTYRGRLPAHVPEAGGARRILLVYRRQRRPNGAGNPILADPR